MEISRLNLNIAAAGKSDTPGTKRDITLEQVVKWINHKRYNEHVKRKLIAAASARPASALPRFIDTIGSRISKISDELKKNE